MNYCCTNFEVNVKFPSTTAPNIRIVKYLPKPIWDNKVVYGFYITMGYNQFDISLPKMTISFCPYCGILLREFYKDANYVNEEEGKTF